MAKKSKVIQVLCTEEEYNYIKSKAQDNVLSMSEYMMRKANIRQLLRQQQKQQQESAMPKSNISFD